VASWYSTCTDAVHLLTRTVQVAQEMVRHQAKVAAGLPQNVSSGNLAAMAAAAAGNAGGVLNGVAGDGGGGAAGAGSSHAAHTATASAPPSVIAPLQPPPQIEKVCLQR
jgi:hypothetical protein